jgi:signal transduction histidine kinase
MTFVVNADAMDREPPPDARVICYRIAQEAIANVRKHARASHVEVVLVSEGGGTRVVIRDDGVGFDPERTAPAPGHLGLPDMRERAELAGGWLRISSAPGSGTVVEFWIPSWAA